MTRVDLNTPRDLSAREQQIAALAASLARELAPSAAEHDRVGTFPLAHYQRLHESGYLRLALPCDHGGGAANLFEMVLAQERLAQGDAATAVGVGMLLNVIGRMGEESAWPEPVFAQVCQTIAREGGLVNSVVTEPDLGSISRGGVPATTATRVPGGWTERPQDRPHLGAQIAATKHFVTNTACSVTELGLRVAGGFSLTRRLTLERHFRDARGGLFQPPQDDLALGLLGRTALAARRHSKEIP